MIHPLSSVSTQNIGNRTSVWQYAIILEGARIGDDCNINCHTFIENDVILGDRVTVKSGVFLWDGISVEDDVFIGPNASFVNDKFPRSKIYPEAFQRTVLRKGCTIGSNATVLGGLEVGKFAFIGAGSVVTSSVPDYALIVGNPARRIGWMGENREKLIFTEGFWTDTMGNKFVECEGALQKL